MKTNLTNLLVVFLLLALTNVLKAQCTKEDIKVPSDLVFNAEIEEGPKTLILETIGVKELRLSLYNSRGAKIFESTSSILGASKEIRRREGKVALCCLNQYVNEIFEVSGFSSMIPIKDSIEEGLKDLS